MRKPGKRKKVSEKRDKWLAKEAFAWYFCFLVFFARERMRRKGLCCVFARERLMLHLYPAINTTCLMHNYEDKKGTATVTQRDKLSVIRERRKKEILIARIPTQKKENTRHSSFSSCAYAKCVRGTARGEEKCVHKFWLWCSLASRDKDVCSK